MPPGGRGPRSARRSRSRAAARQAAGERPAPASGCFSRPSMRHRRQVLGDRGGEEAQEGGLRRLAERLAGAVIRHHAEAHELARDAGGQLAIRRDQRGARAWGLQSFS